MTGEGPGGEVEDVMRRSEARKGRHAQASDMHLVTLRKARVNSSRHRRGLVWSLCSVLKSIISKK